jgi:hypothetical protein
MSNGTTDPTPVDVNQAYLSGMWKRRDGDNVQTSDGVQQQQWKANQQLDPWNRRSPPAKDV